MSQSTTVRIVAGLVGGVVAVGNGVFGWHLGTTNVVVVGACAAAVVFGEAYVEGKLHASKSGNGFLDEIGSVLDKIPALVEAVDHHRAAGAPAATDPATTTTNAAPAGKA